MRERDEFVNECNEFTNSGEGSANNGTENLCHSERSEESPCKVSGLVSKEVSKNVIATNDFTSPLEGEVCFQVEHERNLENRVRGKRLRNKCAMTTGRHPELDLASINVNKINRFRVKHAMTDKCNDRNILLTYLPTNLLTCKRCLSRIIRVVAGVTSGSNLRAGFAIAHTAPYRKFGFTLAEMMVVLLIMTIVLAAAAPVMTTRYSRDTSQPWKWLSTNSPHAYFGNIPSQVAMIGQNNEPNATEQQAKLIINNPSLHDHILFKSGEDILAKLHFANGGMALGSLADGTTLGDNTILLGKNSASGNNSIILGNNITSPGASTILIGNGAASGGSTVYNGNGSIAIGHNSSATYSRGDFPGVAVGQSAKTIGSSVAVGYNSASGFWSTAVGANVTAADLSTVIGAASKSTGNGVAVGRDLTTGNGIVIGADSHANASNIVIGNNSSAGIKCNSDTNKLEKDEDGNYIPVANSTTGIAIGRNAHSVGNLANSIGNMAYAENVYAMAIGDSARAVGVSALAIGTSAEANSGTAIGFQAKTSNQASMAIGGNAQATAGSAIALGTKAQAGNESTVALSSNANATGNYAIAIGSGSQASTFGAIAIGRASNVKAGTTNGVYSIAMGFQATTLGTYSIAIGSGTKAETTCALALGAAAKASGKGSIAIGFNDSIYRAAEASGANAIAIGSSNYGSGGLASGDNSIALGYGAEATALNAVAIGKSAVANTANTIVLGSNHDVIIPNSLTVNYVAVPSDKRLKNIDKEFTSGLDKIRELKVFNFTYKDDKTKTPRVGVIAQDLQKVFPSAVKKDSKGFLSVRMEDMFYAVINAIKELDAKFDALRKENEQLKKRCNDLEKRLEALEQKVK